jgi:hypothetical protein
LIRLELLAVLLMVAPVLADPPEPAVVDAVANIYRPFPPDQQKLGGIIGVRLRANSEGYIERIGNPPAKTAEEQIGTLLDAAVYTFEYNHDSQVSAVMVRLARKLIASQAADGYFGARTGAEQWTALDTTTQSADLLGLLNYYRVMGDPAARSAATKLGDLLVKEQHRRPSDDANLFAGALEAMAGLFRYTDNHKYLEFCNSVAGHWLRTKPPELQVTYQNLAVLNGLVELYRLNGDNSVFRTPVQAWTEMHASGFTLTGAPADGAGNSQALNACATADWLHLSANLLRISGQAVYGEQIERTVYNQLFAGQDAKTGAVLAPVAWNSKKEPANTDACAANEVRALSEVPSLVWGRYGNGIVLNLYTDGRVTVRLRRRGTIHIYTETNYPETGNILLHIEPDHPIHFPLRLRVPDWATKFTADVGRDHFIGKPGDFLTINRGWTRGETLKISIGMGARTIPGVREFSAEVAIARGPQLLALGTTLNPDLTNLDAVTVDRATSAGIQLLPIATKYATNWMGDQGYVVSGAYEGQPKKLILVPFANALNYRVWLAQSKASSGTSDR